MRPYLSAAVAAAVALAGGAATAQSWVAFLHTPPAVQHADADLVLAGNLIGAGPDDRVAVRYRHPGDASYQSVPITPAYGDTYQAVIPAREVVPPAIEYYVEWVHKGGAPQAIFASADHPQVVKVVTGSGAATASGGTSKAGGTGHATATTHGGHETGGGRTSGAGQPTGHGAVAPGGARAGSRGGHGGRRAAGGSTGSQGTSGRTGGAPAPAARAGHFVAEGSTTLATLKRQSIQQAPAIVSIVTRRQMREMGAAHLVDVLKTIPGLEVSRDVQGFYQVSVRGITSDPEVLLLYDGQRLSNLYDGRNLYELPVENIARVEVIRGPGSALYGGGAFLAVVNVVPTDHVGLDLETSADTFGILDGHAGYGVKVGKGLVRFEGDIEGGQGYSLPVPKDAYHTQDGDPAGATSDQHLLADLGVRGRHPAGSGTLTWSLRGLWQDRAALLGAFDTVGAGSRLTWLTVLGNVGYALKIPGGRLDFKLDGDLQKTDRLFQLSPAPFVTATGSTFKDGVLERTLTVTHAYGLSATGTFDLFHGNEITLGLDARQERLSDFFYGVNFDPATGEPLASVQTPAGIVFPANDPGLTQRLALGVFAQDAWTLVPGLDLTLGFRADLFSGGVGRTDPAAKKGTKGSEFAANPRLALVWQPTPQWSLKALYATAFRVPTFEELTSVVVQGDYSRGRFVGNSTLQPVHIRTAELGVEHLFATGSRHRVSIRVNGFYNQFLGDIEAVDLTGNVTPLFNRDGAIDVYGAEGEGRIDFSPRDRITAAMAWFRAIDSQAPQGRNLLTTVPQLRFILETQVGLGRVLDLHIGATFGAERRNNARSSLEALRRFSIPAYALVDATLKTRPVGAFTFAVTVENLLDSTYLDPVPRPDRVTGLLPEPGLSARLTVRARW